MAGQPGLRSSSVVLHEGFDTVLLDLDGVVYIGPHLVEGADAAVAAVRAAGRRVAFVTNNASRPPADVAEQLTGIGVPAGPADVVTAAQAAATLLAAALPAGSRVLVVGGEGLTSALTDAGLRPVDSETEDPQAVVSGFSPDVGWRALAEGTYAVRRRLLWVASNLDMTVPTPRGAAPGNGTLVGVISAATGRRPDQVAGKPEPALLTEACRRTGAERPLFVGDRLDTDVVGARRAGLPSLLVLTGVSDAVDLVTAPPEQRPDFLAADLGGLLTAHPAPVDQAGGWSCGGWLVRRQGERLDVGGSGDPIDGLRAVCGAAWSGPSQLDRDRAAEAVAAVGLAGRAGGPAGPARAETGS